METSQQMISYTQPSINQIDPTMLLGALSLIMLLGVNTKKQYQIAALKREQTMSQQHQAVLTADICDLEDAISHLTAVAIPKDDIQSAIISFLGNDRRGMKVKDIHHAIAESMPNVTKSEVNSMLYKLGNKKILRKVSVSKAAPTWILV